MRSEIGQAKRDELSIATLQHPLPLDPVCLILAPLLLCGTHQEFNLYSSRLAVFSALCSFVHRALGRRSPIHNNTTPGQPPASIAHTLVVIGAYAGGVSLLLMLP
jgi:hypothetical protein